ncbi:hypothetical protein [Saccharopolyspora sp. 5N708]|uniref:hypothetical protein n=1 Tax=Saccharopolyspora sp. 5N708 TaxID=3457424 RepID=UPI003FCF5795
MADDPQGLDYWLESDAWQDTQFADWPKLDGYVDNGYMAPHERDLIQAQASMAALNPGGGAGGFPEVDAAWEKYLQVDEQHSDDPEFNEDLPADQIPAPNYGGGFDENKDYYPRLPHTELSDEQKPAKPTAPNVPGAKGEGGGGEGKVEVNTEALKTFGTNVSTLRDIISGARGVVEGIDVKPGAFHNAYELRGKVMGAEDGGGLKASVLDFMTNTTEALTDIDTDIQEIARQYTTTEDLNGLEGTKLEEMMAESFTTIDNSPNAGGEQ